LDPSTVVLGVFNHFFPDSRSENSNNELPFLVLPLLKPIDVILPIPVTYYENLMSKTYWEMHVRSLGMVQIPDLVTASLWSDPGHDYIVIPHSNLYSFKMSRIRKRMRRTTILLDPEERREHLHLMKRDMIARYHPLTLARDRVAQKVINLDELYLQLTDAEIPVFQMYEIIDAIESLLACVTEPPIP